MNDNPVPGLPSWFDELGPLKKIVNLALNENVNYDMLPDEEEIASLVQDLKTAVKRNPVIYTEGLSKEYRNHYTIEIGYLSINVQDLNKSLYTNGYVLPYNQKKSDYLHMLRPFLDDLRSFYEKILD
jgi:hypothetical protein